jgi:hypothetical protein
MWDRLHRPDRSAHPGRGLQKINTYWLSCGTLIMGPQWCEYRLWLRIQVHWAYTQKP